MGAGTGFALGAEEEREAHDEASVCFKSLVLALVSQSQRDLDLMAPWSSPGQAGEGLTASPSFWRLCPFKARFKTSRTAEGG